jgi:ADP-L-glycero-D-manno-heptose 6-epimerase
MHIDLDLNGKTVLVTGGAGFIGSNLALHIEAQYPDCRVVVLEGFNLGHFHNLRGFRGECISADIARADDLRRLADLPFDYLFHQAAISDTTVTDQQLVVRVNTNAFADLLDLAIERNAPVVYASSAGVYGNSPAPNRVGHGEQPENVYGFSKLMMDHVAARVAKQHGLPIVGLRYFNVYGPREQYKGTTASMILQLASQLLDGRRPRLFNHGQQQRDFVYIEDVVQANLKAIASGQSGVFNVGSGEARSFNDIVEILSGELGIDVETEYVANPWSFYQNHTEADIGPTRKQLGYEPRFRLEEGVRAYLPEILTICGKELETCIT